MIILDTLVVVVVVVVVVDCPWDTRFFSFTLRGHSTTVFCKISCSEKHILPRIFYHY